MGHKKNIFLFICLIFVSYSSYAIDVVECQDEEGRRVFFKTCPPGSSLVSKKSYHSKSNKKDTSPKLAVIHYYATECGACDQVRDFFKLRKIDIIEKNVNENVELQAELKLLANELRVPTVVINEELIQGFNRKKLLNSLTNAGWKEE